MLRQIRGETAMRLVSFIFLGGLLCGAASGPASAQTPDPEFGAAAGQYIACMVMTVRMGMTVKMDPDTFKTGFDKACKPQEARFRAAAIKQAMASGRTEAEAEAEIEGNIARGKAIWAADQESYIRTGKVPR
jgi:hypothetical protein